MCLLCAFLRMPVSMPMGDGHVLPEPMSLRAGGGAARHRPQLGRAAALLAIKRCVSMTLQLLNMQFALSIVVEVPYLPTRYSRLYATPKSNQPCVQSLIATRTLVVTPTLTVYVVLAWMSSGSISSRCSPALRRSFVAMTAGCRPGYTRVRHLCRKCPAGTAKLHSGDGGCSHCGGNTVSARPGSTRCHSCPKGFKQTAGHTRCVRPSKRPPTSARAVCGNGKRGTCKDRKQCCSVYGYCDADCAHCCTYYYSGPRGLSLILYHTLGFGCLSTLQIDCEAAHIT